VEINGVHLFVRTAGPPDGFPLLLLHGWPDTGDGWRRVAGRLEDTFRLIIPDQRGFGGSSMPKGTTSYALSRLMGDIMGLAEWARVERLGIVGHDFGGAMAWGAGTFLGGLVERIVVMSVPHPKNWKLVAAGNPEQMARSAYTFLLNLGEEGEAVLAAGEYRELADWVYGSVLSDGEKDSLRANWSEPGRFHAMAEWYRANYRPSLLDASVPVNLPDVTVPTRYLHGLDDFAFVPALARGNGAFVSAEYDEILIGDGGHWLQLTHPDLVADAVRDWMTRSSGSR
ncbi:MAG: alpha/beta fold hydrolase, partial [Acidimicrobiia bacterium]|nr:alpha/beta fold hydrolase [Acidimicrobiia bacterium]